jgi:serine/threonine protein phosphatase PrpC
MFLTWKHRTKHH